MAAGYRSRVFWWFTGYNAGGSGPVVPGCPCPEWKTDGTLHNAFARPKEGSCVEYTKPKTLPNAWVRKACD